MRLEPSTDAFPLTEELLEARPESLIPARSAERLDGIVIGTLAEFDAAGCPCVEFPGNPEVRPLTARSTAALAPADRGRSVALMFEGGDPRRPIVLGLIQNPAPAPTSAWKVEADGERVVVSAEKEMVFRCGQASITLTRAGKVL